MNKQIDRKTLAKEIHQNAVDKGFWHTKHSTQHYLMLVICELSEAVEAHRKDKRANRQAYETRTINGFESKVFELYIKDTLEDELADAYIRLLDLAEGFGYELETEELEVEHVGYEAGKEDYVDRPFIEIVFEWVAWISHRFHKDSINADLDDLPYLLIAIASLADVQGIDLSWHITEKMKYNATRPTLHGKRY